MRLKKQKGFTLIELLVVIAIIALLASIVLIALGSAHEHSRDAKRLGDIKQLGTALELYYNTSGVYPLTAAGLGGLVPTYIGAVPTAPLPFDPGTPAVCTAANNAYKYTSATGSAYTLTFCLGATSGGLAAGAHTESSTSGLQ